MSEAEIVEVRRRRSRAEADRLAAEFEASGLTREEFCRQQGLALATLARYRKQRQQDRGELGSGTRWVAVELAAAKPAAVSGADSGLTVVLANGRRIEVAPLFDPRTLGELLPLLEQA
jgi:hypothetical protein